VAGTPDKTFNSKTWIEEYARDVCLLVFGSGFFGGRRKRRLFSFSWGPAKEIYFVFFRTITGYIKGSSWIVDIISSWGKVVWYERTLETKKFMGAV